MTTKKNTSTTLMSPDTSGLVSAPLNEQAEQTIAIGLSQRKTKTKNLEKIGTGKNHKKNKKKLTPRNRGKSDVSGKKDSPDYSGYYPVPPFGRLHRWSFIL